MGTVVALYGNLCLQVGKAIVYETSPLYSVTV